MKRVKTAMIVICLVGAVFACMKPAKAAATTEAHHRAWVQEGAPEDEPTAYIDNVKNILPNILPIINLLITVVIFGGFAVSIYLDYRVLRRYNQKAKRWKEGGV